ncbi:hypothetical protein FGG08_000322 [Glutinoglossum americanum]|uniref:Heterokaryon incompatibility domain-containing protein n=1 Tax=Glutinoglossum americanum TaxID=1670608 RepID=A0A9P8IDS1_9PEZI|nr:hypothetical protein FGG08_000322 [Glutinoglossum americanum]
MNCSICGVLLEEFPHQLDASKFSDKTPLSTTAKLPAEETNSREIVYRLDFKLELEHCSFKGSRTFILKDTIRNQFACRLEEVGYLWADALCILQDFGEQNDWLSQSAEMDQVYGESYLNISATIVKNDYDGLYFRRDSDCLWEDEIRLDIAGILRAQSHSTRDSHQLGAVSRLKLWEDWEELVPDLS